MGTAAVVAVVALAVAAVVRSRRCCEIAEVRGGEARSFSGVTTR